MSITKKMKVAIILLLMACMQMSAALNSTGAPRKPELANTGLALWYNHPAAYWEEALPLGNGRLGVMHSGGVAKDTLQLNEDTFWDAGPNENYNEKALSVLQQVREGIFAKDYASVQRLAVENFNSPGSQGAAYRAGGVVLIGFPGHQFSTGEAGATTGAYTATGYARWLDMTNATSNVTYNLSNVH